MFRASGGIRIRSVALGMGSLLVASVLQVTAAAPALAAGPTVRASADADGTPVSDVDSFSAISGDGRFVAFVTSDSLVGDQDANGAFDIYRKDLEDGSVDLVTAGPDGQAAGGLSGGYYDMDLSFDGSRLAFETSAPVVEADTDLANDIFVREWNVDGVGLTFQVNVDDGGTPAAGAAGAYRLSISDDGNRVAFFSRDPLFSGGDIAEAGVHVRDIAAGDTMLVSTADTGLSPLAISGDGSTVAYKDFVVDGEAVSNLLMSRRADGAGGPVTLNAGADMSPDAEIAGPNAVSFDGQVVAFESAQDDLIGAENDTNEQQDAFIHRGPDFDGNPVLRVSVAANGAQLGALSANGGLSGDGRQIVFWTAAGDVVPELPTPAGFQVYVRDLDRNLTELRSVNRAGDAANSTSFNPRLSNDGDTVSFTSAASNLDGPSGGVFAHTELAPAELAPANVTITVDNAGDGIRATEPGASLVDVNEVPATALPLGPLGEVSGVPLRSVDIASSPLRSVPLRSVPLRSVPLRSVPLRSVPLRSVTLSDLPLSPGSWDAILATLNPNPFAGVPLQAVTLDQALDAFDAQAANQAAQTAIGTVTLGTVDLSSTPLRSVSIASLALGATPLRSVPVPGPNALAFDNWCALLAGLGFSCTDLGLTPDSSVLAVDLAGVPLRSVPLRSVPLRSVPLRSVDLSSAPLRSVPLRSVNLADFPIGTIPLSALDASKRPAIVDCTRADCGDGGDTLAGAAALTPTAIAETATLGDVFDAVDPELLPGSLAELLQALVDVSSYPWEQLPLEVMGIQQYAGPAAPVVTYQVRFDVEGGDGETVPATMVVDLPPGFLYVPGSSHRDDEPILLGDVGPASHGPEPAVDGTRLTWTLDGVSAPSEGDGLSFQARPSLTLGTFAASASVTIVGETANSPKDPEPGPSAVQVVEDFEQGVVLPGGGPGCEIGCQALVLPGENNTPETAPALADDTLLISHIGTPGDIDYYKVPVPAKGTRLDLRLGNLDATTDFDLLLYAPNSTPLRSVPLRSVPLRSVPLVDNGLDAQATGDASLTPEKLDDIPLLDSIALRSVSENRSTADELVSTTSNLEPGAGVFYTVQVTAYNGGSDVKPYTLYVNEYQPPPPPECPAGPRAFAHAGEGVQGPAPGPVPAGMTTIFLINQKRLGDTYGAAATQAAVDKLQAMAANPLVGTGYVLPLDRVPEVTAALDAWDQDPCSPEKANDVFSATAAAVDATQGPGPGTTLKNIVVIGGDDIVPMARVADYTQISNESDYTTDLLLDTPADNGTPLAAAAATQNILTDDPLGDRDPIPWLDHQLFVPDIAVGRIVETPADIMAQVDQFLGSQGVLDPRTALTTGYDFLSDGSQAVNGALTKVPAAGKDTLINDTWSKTDAAAKLFPAAGSPDITSLNAHYDHNKSLPAIGNTTNDETDLFTTADLAGHDGALARRILFTMGCHAGLNAPDAYYPGDAARSADWAQSLGGQAQRAAVYFANSGYGYGDTATVALSEELMRQLAARLDGSMTIGEAGTYAKQAYFAQLGVYGPYDEKAMQEATFFGFPMYKIAGGTPVADPGPAVAPAATPGDPLGVLSAPRLLQPTFQSRNTPGGGRFFTVGPTPLNTAPPQVTQYRPIQPKVVIDVTPPSGLTAKGVLINDLVSTDQPIVPAVARPVIDLASNEPAPLAGDVAFPTNFQTITDFNTPTGPREQVVFLPGQFFRDASSTSAGGIQRLFSTIDAEVKYSATDDFTPPLLTNIQANVTPPPGITASAATNVLHVALDTFDGQGAIARVVVLVKDESGGDWKRLDLAENPAGSGHYEGSIEVVGTHVEYFAQSMDDSGVVGISTNKGRYFSALQVNGVQGTPPRLVADPGRPTGVGGWYTGPVGVAVTGTTDGVTYTTTIDGVPVTLPATLTADGVHLVRVDGDDGTTATLVVAIDHTKKLVYSLDKAIFSNQSLVAGNSIEIKGKDGNDATVYTNGDYTCTNSHKLAGTILAQGRIDLVNSCDIAGDAWSNGPMLLRNSVKVGRDVISSTSSITMQNSVEVGRDAIAGTTVSTGSSAKVKGTIVEHLPQASPPFEALPAVTYSDSAWTAAGYAVRTYASCVSALNDLKAKSDTWVKPTVVHVASTCALDLTDKTTITQRSDLALVTHGPVLLRKDVKFRSTDGRQPRKLFVIVPSGATCTGASAASITMNKGALSDDSVQAFLYTPCTVTAGNSGKVTGQIYGGRVQLSNSFSLVYRPVGAVPGAG